MDICLYITSKISEDFIILVIQYGNILERKKKEWVFIRAGALNWIKNSKCHDILFMKDNNEQY